MAALVIAVLAFQALSIQLVTAQPVTVSIDANGNLDGTNAINRSGNVYTFKSNITSEDNSEGYIAIDASNIVLNGAGFTLKGSITVNGENVEIKNLKITASRTALEVKGSGCKISGNEVTAGVDGIRIYKAGNSVISGNSISSKVINTVDAGISLGFSHNNLITGNTVKARVTLQYSDHNTISGNDVSYISIYSGSDNTVEGNNVPLGLQISTNSSNNKVTGNIIKDFNELNQTHIVGGGSISLSGFETEGNLISSNILVNSGGIFLDSVSNNVLRNNYVNTTKEGFGVSGYTLEQFLNNVDDSNIVNGKRIYCLVNQTDLVITPSTYPKIGFIVLVNCQGVTVRDVNLHTQGILLAYTSYSTITNNNISDVYGNGLTLDQSSNNNITGNIFESDDSVGIRFSDSSQNFVSGNSIVRNGEGISIYSSSGNTVTQNNIANNELGIYLVDSSSNLLCNNNFNHNTKQIYDPSWEAIGSSLPLMVSPSKNTWNNGASVGGNYWSDYNGTDADGNGMGDSPYVLDANNKDNYPLVNAVSVPIIQVPLVFEGDDIAQPTLPPTASDGEGLVPPIETAFPTILVVAISAVVLAIAGAGLIIYFKKRPH